MSEIESKIKIGKLISECYSKVSNLKPPAERIQKKASVEIFIEQEPLKPVETKGFAGWTVKEANLPGGIRAGH